MKKTCNQCQTEMIENYKVESFGGIRVFLPIPPKRYVSMLMRAVPVLHILENNI
ncbi:MAG: hypothetical protein ACREVX_04185 [Clostridium sp.]|uniref:hypothetical protein n=1 Tax=Clostridium sp. TaxID=1506 RepID=UPI003D6CD44C